MRVLPNQIECAVRRLQHQLFEVRIDVLFEMIEDVLFVWSRQIGEGVDFTMGEGGKWVKLETVQMRLWLTNCV